MGEYSKKATVIANRIGEGAVELSCNGHSVFYIGSEGDYVVINPNGSRFIMKAAYFEAMYEPVVAEKKTPIVEKKAPAVEKK